MSQASDPPFISVLTDFRNVDNSGLAGMCDTCRNGQNIELIFSFFTIKEKKKNAVCVDILIITKAYRAVVHWTDILVCY